MASTVAIMGIVLIVILASTGGVILYSLSDSSAEFPITATDPKGDIVFVTTETWNMRGVPTGVEPEDAEQYEQYLKHIDIVNMSVDKGINGLECAMEFDGEVLDLEGIWYGLYIELESASYLVFTSEGRYVCVEGEGGRKPYWGEWLDKENSSFVKEFILEGNEWQFVLDLDVESKNVQYLLGIAGLGEFEWYYDHVEVELFEEQTNDEVQTSFEELTITGDTDFGPHTGVSSGTGTTDDPFIIEGITVYGTFEIIDTTKYLELENVTIMGDGTLCLNGDNIVVRNLNINNTKTYDYMEMSNMMGGLILHGDNIQVSGYTISAVNMPYAVVFSGTNIVVSDVEMSGTLAGFSFAYTKNVTLDSAVLSRVSVGFDMMYAEDVIIKNIWVNDSEQMAYCWGTCASVHFENCGFDGNNQGLWIAAPESSVKRCVFIDNYICIRLEREATNITITENNFIDNNAVIYWQTIPELMPQYYIYDNYFDSDPCQAEYPDYLEEPIEGIGPR